MAKTSTTKIYNFFDQKKALQGGLNVTDDPLIVGPNEMTVAKNVLIGQSLARQKRPGLENYHTGNFEGTASYPASGVPIRGILQYYRYGSGTGEVYEDIFLHQSDKVWSIGTRTSEGINQTGSLTLSTTGIPSYQVFEGILYFVTSETADGYNKWNGLAEPPGVAEAATAPLDGVGKLLGNYFGRMLMAGNPDFPFRVYMSAALDAEDWSGMDATSFDLTYDGDPTGVTAIFPELDGRVFIATRRSIYELSTTDPANLNNFSIRRVTRGIGCVGQGTVVATPNDVLFASDRGIHSIKKVVVSDQSEISFLSRDIQNLWVSLLNAQRLNQAQATWEETQNLYVITVPVAGELTNSTVLCYNLTFGYWTLWEDVDARSLNTVLISNRQYILAGREDGKVAFFNPSETTDFGTGYSFIMKTGKFFPDSMMTNQFRFTAVTIMVSATQPSTISLGWFVDSVNGTRTGSRAQNIGADSDALGSTFVLGSSRLGIGSFVPVRFSIEETGYNIQLQVTAGGTSDIKFLGYILEVEDADPVYT
jgi:hypothetical protein